MGSTFDGAEILMGLPLKGPRTRIKYHQVALRFREGAFKMAFTPGLTRSVDIDGDRFLRGESLMGRGF